MLIYYKISFVELIFMKKMPAKNVINQHSFKEISKFKWEAEGDFLNTNYTHKIIILNLNFRSYLE